MVPVAKQTLGSSGVRVASVATAFPSGRAALDIKLADTRDAVDAGADEIDMVIDRGAFLSGRYLEVHDEIVAVKEACGGGSPEGHPRDRRARRPTTTYAGPAGWPCSPAPHFIKTSTGKVSPAATLPVTLVMLEAVRDFREATGQMVGVKPAGGIRTAKDAIKYLVMVNETAGPDWLDPDWFRFGASSLLNDLLMQRMKISTGRYSGPDYVTLDWTDDLRVLPRPRVARGRRPAVLLRALRQRRVRRRLRPAVQDDLAEPPRRCSPRSPRPTRPTSTAP